MFLVNGMRATLRQFNRTDDDSVFDDQNYKDVPIITKYITEKGKIVNRRQSGACAKHQRHISQQIKYARFMALIPYVKD